MHLKTNDIVEIISGDDRGLRGKILVIDREAGKVVVEGMNRVNKHVRRSQKNPQGGRLSKEMPVSLSNVMLVCTACNQSSRTGVKFRADGTKERFCKKCKAAIGVIATFIYLSIQIRQNTKAVRSSSIQNLVQSFSTTAQAAVENEYVIPLLLKANAGADSLTRPGHIGLPGL